MVTQKEQLDNLQQNHEAVMGQINKVHESTRQFMDNSVSEANKLFQAGKYQESADVMHKMMDGVQAKNKIIEQASKQNAENIQKVLSTPSNSTKIPSSKSLLPDGISKGKVAAIAAGVAVVGGGILLYRNHQQKKRESWAARIEQERMNTTQRGISY